MRRFSQHQKGIGGKQTSDLKKRPWGLVGYIAGFEADKVKMRQFETAWKLSRERLGGDGLDAQAVFDIGVSVITTWRRNGVTLDLIPVLCGKFGL